MKENPSLLTPEQVAAILQVHILTVYGYIRRGRLDAVRLGRSYRIVPEDLAGFIRANRISQGIQSESTGVDYDECKR